MTSARNAKTYRFAAISQSYTNPLPLDVRVGGKLRNKFVICFWEKDFFSVCFEKPSQQHPFRRNAHNVIDYKI
jgi:hypothetical protein